MSSIVGEIAYSESSNALRAAAIADPEPISKLILTIASVIQSIFGFGSGCGAACIDASATEQVFERMSDDFAALGRAGYLTQKEANAANQAVYQSAISTMARGDSQMKRGLANAKRVISGESQAYLAAPASNPTVWDANAAMAILEAIPSRGWYPQSVAKANQMAIQIIEQVVLPGRSSSMTSSITTLAKSSVGKIGLIAGAALLAAHFAIGQVIQGTSFRKLYPSLSPPSINTQVIGGRGTATASYWVTAVGPQGETLPSEVLRQDVPNTLSASNYVLISIVNPESNAFEYNVYKSDSSSFPTSPSLICTITIQPFSCQDTGQTALAGAPPTFAPPTYQSVEPLPVLNASQFPGNDACSKINNANSAAVAAGGGVVDARGILGTQTCAAGITIGSPTVTVHLKLNALLKTGAMSQLLGNNSSISCEPQRGNGACGLEANASMQAVLEMGDGTTDYVTQGLSHVSFNGNSAATGNATYAIWINGSSHYYMNEVSAGAVDGNVIEDSTTLSSGDCCGHIFGGNFGYSVAGSGGDGIYVGTNASDTFATQLSLHNNDGNGIELHSGAWRISQPDISGNGKSAILDYAGANYFEGGGQIFNSSPTGASPTIDINPSGTSFVGGDFFIGLSINAGGTDDVLENDSGLNVWQGNFFQYGSGTDYALHAVESSAGIARADRVTGNWFGNSFTAPGFLYNITGGATSGGACGYYNCVIYSSNSFGNTQAPGFNVVTFSATPAFDASLGSTSSQGPSFQQINLSANVTGGSVTNLQPGELLDMRICENSTGGFTWTWPTTVDGITSTWDSEGTISTTANTCNQQMFVYLGNGTVLAVNTMGQL